MHSEIILLGPVRTGKSTLSRLLSEKLGLPRVSLDDLRRGYYAEIGYEEELAQSFRKAGGFLALYLYWNQFDAYAIERALSEYANCIFDFGAGNGISESKEGAARVQVALAPYPNVFLILPSPDPEESLVILRNRDRHAPVDMNFDLNRRFLEHPSYRTLAKHTIYTLGRLPEETRDEIIGLLAS